MDTNNTDKLNQLYRCAEAQSNIINTVISKTDDDNFKKNLSQHLHKFRALESELARTLQQNNSSAQGISKLESMLDSTTARLKLMGSSSPAQIAGLLESYTLKRMSAMECSSPATDSCTLQVQELNSKLKSTQQALITGVQSYVEG